MSASLHGEQFVHGIAVFSAIGIGNLLSQHLIELLLEHLFGPASVEIGGFVLGLSGGLEHLAEQGLTNKGVEDLSEFVVAGNVVSALLGGVKAVGRTWLVATGGKPIPKCWS